MKHFFWDTFPLNVFYVQFFQSKKWLLFFLKNFITCKMMTYRREYNEKWILTPNPGLHLLLLLPKAIQFSSVQLLSRVRLFATPWIAACQAPLSITNSRSSLKLTSIESVMPSSHLILCCRLLFLPPIPPSIRVFSNESALLMRWPEYWSFSYYCSVYLISYMS